MRPFWASYDLPFKVYPKVCYILSLKWRIFTDILALTVKIDVFCQIFLFTNHCPILAYKCLEHCIGLAAAVFEFIDYKDEAEYEKK